jgi:hypothetical protein
MKTHKIEGILTRQNKCEFYILFFNNCMAYAIRHHKRLLAKEKSTKNMNEKLLFESALFTMCYKCGEMH